MGSIQLMPLSILHSLLGWQIEAPPFFHLKFSHANILNEETSILDVSLNGLPISSALLNEDNRENGELIIALPVHLLTDGANQLRVSVDMDMPLTQDQCSGQADQRAWTVISSLSEIFVPYTVGLVNQELRSFPYPFSGENGIEDTYIILPDEPTNASIGQLIQLAVRLGVSSGSDKLAIPVAFASEVDDDIRENNHLIVLGRPTDNTFTAEFNDQLPHPFIPNSDILQPLRIDTVVFLPDPNRNAGVLQILDSPWNQDNSLVSISGTTDEGIRLGVLALTAGGRRQLRGNLAVVEPIYDPLSTEVDQYAIYATDTSTTQTRRSIDTFQDNSDLSGNQEIGLSERWWK